MAENTVDTLKIEVSADAKKAIKELSGLSKVLSEFAKYDKSFDGVQKSADQATEAWKRGSKELENLRQRLSKPIDGSIKKAADTTGQLAKKTQEVTRNYDDLVVAGKTFDDLVKGSTRNMDAAKKKASEMSGAIQGGSQAMVKTAAGKINNQPQQELNQYLNDVDIVGNGKKAHLNFNFEEWKNAKDVVAKLVPIAKDASDSTEKLAASTEKASASFKNLATSTKTASNASKTFANNAKGVVKLGFDKVANSLRGSFAGLNKQIKYLGSAIKNTLVYSTISKFFAAITDGVKTGTDNLYQYSKIINGTFAGSMDRLASSLQYLQNSIGAAVAPLINTFAPAIDAAIDKVVEFINSINQLIAKLTGASTWTKAVKGQKEYAEAADSAAAANKNLLAGFDELNVIQSQSSGSSKSTPDYGSMFEEVSLDNYVLPDFVQQIRDQIEAGDWTGVGQTLGEKVNDVVQSIDWTGVGQTLGEKVNDVVQSIDWAAAGDNIGKGLQHLIDTYNGFMRTVDWSGIGTGLGESLNNIMANVDFESAGAVFAQKWNALIGVLHGFITTTDWEAVGSSIAGFINGWFDEIDWTMLGQTISDGVKSLLTALRTAVQETDWKSIGGSISESLNQIDWSGIISGAFGLLSDAIKGILDLLIGAVQGLDWYDLGTEVYESITETIQNIDFDGMASRLMEGIGSALAGLAQFLIGLIAPAWEDLMKWWKETAFEDGEFTLQGLLDGIVEKLKNIGTWLKDNVYTPFVEGFKKMFGIHSPSTVMAEMGGFLIDGLLGGLKDKWNGITTWFTNIVTWIKTKLTGGFTDIKNSVVKIWEGLWSGVKGVFNSLLGGVEKMANGIVKGINKVIDTFNTLSFDIPDWVPGIGGESFGFNIPSIPQVSIPRLASGGVATGPSLAMIGEYPSAASNPEIVAPQSVIYDTVVSANGRQEQLLVQLINLTRQLVQKDTTVTLAPSAALGRVNAKSNQLYAAATGGY